MILRSFLDNFPRDKVLVSSPSGQWNVDRILRGQEVSYRNIIGARVALYLLDVGAALRTLVALDGVAETILLLSPSIEPGLVHVLAARANCDIVIADNPDGVIEKDGIQNVSINLESINPPSTHRQLPEKTSWLLTTSGTTGEPKLVSHSLASLIRATKIDPSRGVGICWGLLFDYTRFAGLQVLLQSVISGSTLIAPATDSPLEDKLTAFAQGNCTHLSATPTMWRKIAMTPGAENLPLKQVTLGGEISDDRILAMLSKFYPSARVTHIYASTEGGVGFSVNDRRAGFPEHYLDVPPMGILLRVVDGNLHIKNDAVEKSYVGTKISFQTEDGWIDTGDIVTINEGRVFFLGRASGLINVGGNKVYPEEVERVLLSHPEVVAARVYSKSSPITGALVAAEVVLKSYLIDSKTIKSEIRAFASSALDKKYKVPAIINVVTSISCNSAGKLDRGKI